MSLPSMWARIVAPAASRARAASPSSCHGSGSWRKTSAPWPSPTGPDTERATMPPCSPEGSQGFGSPKRWTSTPSARVGSPSAASASRTAPLCTMMGWSAFGAGARAMADSALRRARARRSAGSEGTSAPKMPPSGPSGRPGVRGCGKRPPRGRRPGRGGEPPGAKGFGKAGAPSLESFGSFGSFRSTGSGVCGDLTGPGAGPPPASVRSKRRRRAAERGGAALSRPDVVARACGIRGRSRGSRVSAVPAKPDRWIPPSTGLPSVGLGGMPCHDARRENASEVDDSAAGAPAAGRALPTTSS